jgi:thiol-disulfide isomerase/thioredoxin
MRIRGITMDVVVNIAMLATCAVVAVAVVSRWQRARPAEPQAPIAVGDRAEGLPSVNYARADSTIVLYLRSSCHYCAASMPFYRRLADEAVKHEIQVVAASAEPVEVFESYLTSSKLHVAQAVSFTGRVRGTPTVVFVNRAGTVTRVLVGQQTEDVEAQVVAAVRGS